LMVVIKGIRHRAVACLSYRCDLWGKQHAFV
jgi:hypothetical protein